MEPTTQPTLNAPWAGNPNIEVEYSHLTNVWTVAFSSGSQRLTTDVDEDGHYIYWDGSNWIGLAEAWGRVGAINTHRIDCTHVDCEFTSSLIQGGPALMMFHWFEHEQADGFPHKVGPDLGPYSVSQRRDLWRKFRENDNSWDFEWGTPDPEEVEREREARKRIKEAEAKRKATEAINKARWVTVQRDHTDSFTSTDPFNYDEN